jgi:hypothetical protein
MQVSSAVALGAPIRDLLQALRPRGELSAYYDFISGAALFPQFAAVAAHLRPGMDCWVPFENLDEFRRFAEGLGLAVSFDCAFRELSSQARDRVVGIETLCTTYATGVRIEDAAIGDSVHTFVAGTSDVAEQMRACGWYPVVVRDRLFHKPVVEPFGIWPVARVSRLLRRFLWKKQQLEQDQLLRGGLSRHQSELRLSHELLRQEPRLQPYVPHSLPFRLLQHDPLFHGAGEIPRWLRARIRRRLSTTVA